MRRRNPVVANPIARSSSPRNEKRSRRAGQRGLIAPRANQSSRLPIRDDCVRGLAVTPTLARSRSHSASAPSGVCGDRASTGASSALLSPASGRGRRVGCVAPFVRQESRAVPVPGLRSLPLRERSSCAACTRWAARSGRLRQRPAFAGPPIPSKHDHILRRHSRIQSRCDIDDRAVAWPGGAVISSLPARALLQLVLLDSDVENVAGFRNCLCEQHSCGRASRPQWLSHPHKPRLRGRRAGRGCPTCCKSPLGGDQVRHSVSGFPAAATGY